MTEQVEKILSGLVAQIINSRELAINIGENHGVQEGMKFSVLARTPIEVRDPDTEEVLDVIDREKVRVEAFEVRPKITVCRTYRKTIIPGGPMYTALEGLASSGFLDTPRVIDETLKADDKSLPEPLSPEESYVKIGDRVILVNND